MQGTLLKRIPVSAGASRRAAGWSLLLAALQELPGPPAAPSAVALSAPAEREAPVSAAGEVDFKSAPHSSDAAMLLRWIRRTNDNRGHPFAVIDKRNARLFVFQGSGALSGATPILLGSAKGDGTAPGVGDKAIADVLPSERTTPAGRFVGEHGSNARKENIIWIDYNAAVSTISLAVSAALKWITEIPLMRASRLMWPALAEHSPLSNQLRESGTQNRTTAFAYGRCA